MSTESELDRIGVQSEVRDVFHSSNGEAIMRARCRIDNSALPVPQHFSSGDWLDVDVRARVFDAEAVAKRHALPDEPLAEGGQVRLSLRTEWTSVDLPLPPLPMGVYVAVAKVNSHDLRYRKPFNPSNCFASEIAYGFRQA